MYSASGQNASPTSVGDGTAGDRTCECTIAQNSWPASSASIDSRSASWLSMT